MYVMCPTAPLDGLVSIFTALYQFTYYYYYYYYIISRKILYLVVIYFRDEKLTCVVV